ncbi:MAG TPA: sulfite exporter TauE/SafE family protein [Burkholderiaceae bacterium]|nr:sulfite exporter TauE/SafE family protein [Burkholderiaceae bacterium]HQR70060.1 sulfite exporter TauE/SafE family protein [Burkholderiaceae bacterium]
MIALAALLTFVLTTVMAMAGVGAAFVLIPVFLALGVELHTAMASALLLNAVAMTMATVTFVRRRLVAWRLVLPMLVLAVAASPLGVRLALRLDRSLLMWLFVGFMVLASATMLLYRPKPRPETLSTAAALTLGLPVGSVAGFVGGLLGVGGGNIIVPALIASGLEPKRASASASFVVLFASLSGFLAHASAGHVGTALLVATAVASAAGAALGAWLASEIVSAEQLKRVIAIVLIAVAVKTAWGLI